MTGRPLLGEPERPVYALWEDVEKRVYDAVEGELTDYDPTEGPQSPAQIKWAQDVAKRVQQATMMHLDGYTIEDIYTERAKPKDFCG